MKFFEVVPQNLFTILSSKNRELYVDALFVIRKAFKQEMSINKDDIVSMLISSLEDKILEMDLLSDVIEGGGSEEDVKVSGSVSGRARFILRRLADTGWIDTEYQMDSFDENITLPDYTIKIINLLYSLTEDQTREYNSYVYSTYASLKLADQERDEFMFNALFSAYENTMRLIDELKTLHNNIRRYHQNLNDYATVNEILKDHFDEYKNMITDKVYHPLKTLDSVPRFKGPIQKILGGWLIDYPLREKMAGQALSRGKYSSKDEAVENITVKIGEITDTYEKLDEMLEEIDRKNAAYTRASIEKMRYLLTTDRSIKGKLVELLTRYANDNNKRGRLAEDMSRATDLFSQGCIEEQSLFIRASTYRGKNEEPMKIRPDEETNRDEALFNEFIKRSAEGFSHTRVMRFMQKVLDGADVATSRDIPLKSDEDFILIILAALKGQDKNVFYRVEFLDSVIDNNGYMIPEMRFIRKGI